MCDLNNLSLLNISMMLLHTYEAEGMAAVQNPFNISIFAEKSGPPAWKHLPTWYPISENDQSIPPDVQCTFSNKRMAMLHLCLIQVRLPN